MALTRLVKAAPAAQNGANRANFWLFTDRSLIVGKTDANRCGRRSFSNLHLINCPGFFLRLPAAYFFSLVPFHRSFSVEKKYLIYIFISKGFNLFTILSSRRSASAFRIDYMRLSVVYLPRKSFLSNHATCNPTCGEIRVF